MKKALILPISMFLIYALVLFSPLITLAQKSSYAEETITSVSSSSLSGLPSTQKETSTTSALNETLPVQAQEDALPTSTLDEALPTPTQEDALSAPVQTLPIIVGYSDLDRFQNLSTVEIKHNENEDVYPMLLAIFNLRSINAIVQDPDGSTRHLSLEVVWDYQNGRTSIDASVPGSYTEKGEICLPEGYAWGENVVQEVSMPVEVIIPDENAIIVSMATWNEASYAIEAGASLEEFLKDNVLSSHLTYDQEGTSYPSKITWDISGIDTSVPGLYTVYGSLSPALYTEFSKDFNPQLTIHFSVQNVNQPELSCVQSNLDWSLLHFYWVAPDLNMDTARVMLATNDEAFVSLTQYDDYSLTADGMELYLDKFSGNATYHLQVHWENVSTGIFTFNYDADNVAYEFGKYDVSGDRDGGDSYGPPPTGEAPSLNTQPPENTQTDILPPASNHPQSSTPTSSSPSEEDNPPASSTPAIEGNAPAPSTSALESNASAGKNNTSTSSTADINQADIASAQNTTPEIAPSESSSQTTSWQKEASTQLESIKQDGSNKEETEKSKEEEKAFDELLDSADYIRQHNETVSLESKGRTSISGAQLKLMAAGASGARFSYEGLTLTLPIEGIEHLNIQDSDMVMITLADTEDTGFLLEIMVNGNAITEFSNMEIMVPYTPSSPVSVLQLTNSLGEEVASGTYDEGNGIVAFSLNHTGEFTISDDFTPEKKAEEKEASSFSFPLILLISAGGLCLIGGAGFFFIVTLRKKKEMD